MGTGADSEKMNAKPFAINMTPRVTMNAGMLNSVTKPPVPKPMAAQARIPGAAEQKLRQGGIIATELLDSQCGDDAAEGDEAANG